MLMSVCLCVRGKSFEAIISTRFAHGLKLVVSNNAIFSSPADWKANRLLVYEVADATLEKTGPAWLGEMKTVVLNGVAVIIRQMSYPL
jgi:hypothetical protein